MLKEERAKATEIHLMKIPWVACYQFKKQNKWSLELAWWAQCDHMNSWTQRLSWLKSQKWDRKEAEEIPSTRGAHACCCWLWQRMEPPARECKWLLQGITGWYPADPQQASRNSILQSRGPEFYQKPQWAWEQILSWSLRQGIQLHQILHFGLWTSEQRKKLNPLDF